MRVFLVLLLLLGSAQGFWNRYYDQFDSLHGRHRRDVDENAISPSGTGTEEDAGHHQNGNSHGNKGSHGNASHGNHTEHEGHHGIHVASWNFEYVEPYFIFCVFLITVCLLKLGFHHAQFLSSYIPESCMLILYGTCVGAILYACDISPGFSKLEPDKFFLIILPPIILESAYSLHDRAFMDNMGTIIIYAVLGTLASCFLIGPLLLAFGENDLLGGLEISPTECFVFASLIVAVDPVAVLAIFQEVGVEDRLYFLVFGESLLNDAVTVVLYNMMKAFYFMENIPGSQIGMGVAAFFTVSLGGLLIGICFGILTAILTKYTRHVRVVEPLAVLILAYTSYLSAELFHFSGIISIIGCGLMQAQYAFHNIGYKSEVTIKYFIKMLSGTMDSLIFLLLGIAMVSDRHVWNIAFIAWSIFLCFIVRFVVIFGVTFIANKTYRFKKITLEEQFIMAYGGLRGAVSFSLVNLMDSETFEKRDLFETTTLMVIVFTVFVQGTTIKPLVKLLRVTKPEEEGPSLSIFRSIHWHVNDHMLAGVEAISGRTGRNAARERVDFYDNNYFKHWLQRDPQTKDQVLLDAYQDLEMSLRYQALKAAAKGEPCPDDGAAPLIKDPSTQRTAFADLVREVQRRRSSLALAARATQEPPPNRWQKVLGGFKRKHARSQEDEDVDNINHMMIPVTVLHDITVDITIKLLETHWDLTSGKPQRIGLMRFHQPYDPNLIEDSKSDAWLRLFEKHQQQQLRFRNAATAVDGTGHPYTSQHSRLSQPDVEPLLRASHDHSASPQAKDEIELVQSRHNNNSDRNERDTRTLPV